MRLWLKKLRETAGLTHEQVADRAVISRSYYTNIENGTKTPSVKAAKLIAKVLGFQWEVFFNEKCSFKEHCVTPERREVG